jgi:predicted DNA-binding transcriptional regulator YafY
MPKESALPPPRHIQHERLLFIHYWLQEKWKRPDKHIITCPALVAKMEIKVTRRTVERDIQVMKAPPYNLPIEYDVSSKSYYYTEEVPFFPMGPGVTGEELLALTVARQALAVFAGAKFSEQLRSTFDKVTSGLLNDKNLHGGVTPLDELISFRTPGVGVTESKGFSTILECLLGNFVLDIDYQSKDAAGPVRRTLHPLHLTCLENRWVLIAQDASKAGTAIRTYVVARFSKPGPWGAKTFKRPAGFDPTHYVTSSFGAHSGEGKHLVKVRIAKVGAHHVLERRWHPTQVIAQEPQGSVRMEFTVSDLGDITRWILGFGADCEVLAPPELRASLATEAGRLAALYK